MSCPGHSCFHQLLAPSRRCVLPAAPARAVCLLQAPGSGWYQRVRRAALCSALSLHCFCLPPRCPLGVWWRILFYFAKWSALVPFASATNVVAAIAIEFVVCLVWSPYIHTSLWGAALNSEFTGPQKLPLCCSHFLWTHCKFKPGKPSLSLQ